MTSVDETPNLFWNRTPLFSDPPQPPRSFSGNSSATNSFHDSLGFTSSAHGTPRTTVNSQEIVSGPDSAQRRTASHDTDYHAREQMATPESSPLFSVQRLPSSTTTSQRNGDRSLNALAPAPIITPPPGRSSAQPAEATEVPKPPDFKALNPTTPLASSFSSANRGFPPNEFTKSTSMHNGTPPRSRNGTLPAGSSLPQGSHLETYRPDYLQRGGRPSDFELQDAEADGHLNEHLKNSLSVTTSPEKGRRLKLYEERENSINGVGSTPPPPPLLESLPITPPKKLFSLADEATMESQIKTLPPEKQLKLQKRLEAFSAPRTHTTLKPIELPDKGRVIADEQLFLPKESSSILQSKRPPPKKSKKKKKGPMKSHSMHDVTNDVPDNGSVITSLTDENGAFQKPAWPDDEFPWKQQRDEDNRETARMLAIQRYLLHDSDSSDSGEFELGSSGRNNAPATPPPSRRARGKRVMVNERFQKDLDTMEDELPTGYSGRLHLPMDPSDARAALIAKPEARALIYRSVRRKRAERAADRDGSDDGSLNCVCGLSDDDRPMVRCDGCRSWYHQNCMNITDENDLGEEWFCDTCHSHHMRVVEPTLVPTAEDNVPLRSSPPNVPLYQGPIPGFHAFGTPQFPQTPKSKRRFGYDSSGVGSSLSHSSQMPFWGESQESVNPTTPQQDQSKKSSVKVWSSPTFFDEASTEHDAPFDPMSTPSRGLKFDALLGMAATPKGLGTWSTRPGSMFATPFRGDGVSRFAKTNASPGGFSALEETPNFPESQNDQTRSRFNRELTHSPDPPSSPLANRSFGRVPTFDISKGKGRLDVNEGQVLKGSGVGLDDPFLDRSLGHA
ncbi:hypothetical protein SISSUDRAFT_845593 [Sistotremastrum suecicum HHB10207 ss-3]|uniref:PHD-type domain-containing protein n=1 Tax=Sistotremastrum suecicum HHB10207 ss-3 TaxID=1314776 RepID=A0A166HIU6_9AGAM|nr:hypothetical protein SISSUDRAFT_845593 [Sistotremastrum suecicum HHB10207 ss-3]